MALQPTGALPQARADTGIFSIYPLLFFSSGLTDLQFAFVV